MLRKTNVLISLRRSYRNIRKSLINKALDEVDINKREFREKFNDDFEEGDANFNNLNREYYKKHVDHIEQLKEKEKYLIVKRKYFDRTKLPNFLTWADKQQIKRLHELDAEEWSCERLSEGFPASTDIIKKVIKANWRITNGERVRKHDKAVEENWQKFKRSELKLPDDLSEHINKFTTRTLNFNYEIPPVANNINLPTTGEFVNIINSYKKEPVDSVEHEPKKPLKETYIDNTIDVETDKRVITLKELQNKMVLPGTSDEASPQLQEVDLKSHHTLRSFKQRNNEMVRVKERDNSHLIYPEKITIPKSLREKNKNAVFKLNDCYYDSYGDFLYRVPGMS